jgi:integrase
MPDTTAATSTDEPHRRKKPRNTSKLRDGVMKRGRTWSYVIRVNDSGTGISKPKWVGGFATEEAAKAARTKAG